MNCGEAEPERGATNYERERERHLQQRRRGIRVSPIERSRRAIAQLTSRKRPFRVQLTNRLRSVYSKSHTALNDVNGPGL
jgi:hypothetical protein